MSLGTSVAALSVNQQIVQHLFLRLGGIIGPSGRYFTLSSPLFNNLSLSKQSLRISVNRV
jgi:hypothetical protein